MGTFWGHAATGAPLFLYGLWVFLRSQGSRVLWSMRVNDFLLCAPSLGMILGGLTFFFFELGSALTDDGMSMNHEQHMTMALWIAGGGFAQYMHMKRAVLSNGFAMFLPVTWVAMAVIFLFHPQHSLSLQFGHDALAIMFASAAIAQLIEYWIATTTNPTHHIFQLSFLSQYDRAKQNSLPLPSSGPCPCGCGVSNSKLNPMYNNPYPNGTVFPMIVGFLMMVIGSMDCQMAFDILMRQMRGSKKASSPKEMHMDMDMSADETEWMSAEETLLTHLLLTMVFQIFVAFVLKRIDRSFFADSSSPSSSSSSSSSSNLRWRDDFSLHSPSVPMEKALDQATGRRRDVHIDIDF